MMVKWSVSQADCLSENFGWAKTYVDVSENSGTPKSSISIGFFHYKRLHFGVPLFLETPMCIICEYISFCFLFAFLYLMVFCTWTSFPDHHLKGETLRESQEIEHRNRNSAAVTLQWCSKVFQHLIKSPS